MFVEQNLNGPVGVVKRVRSDWRIVVSVWEGILHGFVLSKIVRLLQFLYNQRPQIVVVGCAEFGQFVAHSGSVTIGWPQSGNCFPRIR
jgi:hypothetical protein